MVIVDRAECLVRRLLVVGAAAQIGEAKSTLRSPEFCLVMANSLEESLRIVRESSFDLILIYLDGLGLEEGISWCRSLVSFDPANVLPAIALSSCGESSVCVRLFQTGVVDFLRQPITSEELVVRIKTLLNHFGRRKESSMVSCGNLEMDVGKYEVFVGKKPVNLTLTEFRLLFYLAKHKGRVLSRQQILADVWGGMSVSKRNVDTHVVTIKRKISNFDHEIRTVYGIGYVIDSGSHCKGLDNQMF